METLYTYAARWLQTRAGNSSYASDRSRIARHVLPVLGEYHACSISKTLIEDLVAELDAKIVAGDISWKTAANAWAVVTTMFSDMVNSKDKSLRTRTDNPTEGVRSPEKGSSRAQPFLYPSEVAALVKHPERGFLYALAIYTGLRAGELRALRWEDIDLEHGVITVSRSVSVDGTPKNGTSRVVPIEALLAVVLASHVLPVVIVSENAEGPVLPNMPPEHTLAEQLRYDLAAAGVKRLALFADCATTRHIVFHDLRGTYATWCAIRGDAPNAIMQRMGHSKLETTCRYIKTAEVRVKGFGKVFGPL